ncbi:hypothetical protein [Streptomyces sp. NPDC002530]
MPVRPGSVRCWNDGRMDKVSDSAILDAIDAGLPDEAGGDHQQ